MRGLDFETFSEVSLPERGLDNYINHPSFRPLLAAVAEFDDQTFRRISVRVYDFVTGEHATVEEEQHAFARNLDSRSQFVAHNAGFERAVLRRAGWEDQTIIDSAVISRAVGAASKLEAAAPQLLNTPKMDVGVELIKKFCMPQNNGYVYIDHVDDWTEEDWDDWDQFKKYCGVDAKLSLLIAEEYRPFIPEHEWRFEKLTQQMNDRGWFVDLPLVQTMNDTFHRNKYDIEDGFYKTFAAKGEKPLNFRSTPQLREWCKKRGLRVKSFDELAVSKLLPQVQRRIEKLEATRSIVPSKSLADLYDVQYMLHVKQELGGSSLSKLEKILQTVGPDGRLRDQYLHVGAGQSFRTSGRGVQMQNLKRLGGGEILDPEEHASSWDNATLARNLRQVFTAQHPQGALLVGDFASVESRGLAYLAGSTWKLDNFHQGRDMYKVLASSMLGVHYDQVDKGQRQTGKVGELSCGYGAGPKAVRSFAEKMGVEFSEEEAGEIVNGWREVNPEITEFWYQLDDMLKTVVEKNRPSASALVGLDHGLTLTILQVSTPSSLKKINPRAQTIAVELKRTGASEPILARYFQGCFMEGRNICYFKPSELKGGPLWRDWWTKDGQRGRYTIYGGKLAGILTQSFCREIFFSSMESVTSAFFHIQNVQLIGQFHDELVLEWSPPQGQYRTMDLEATKKGFQLAMQYGALHLGIQGFPLVANVSTDYRYTK